MPVHGTIASFFFSLPPFLLFLCHSDPDFSEFECQNVRFKPEALDQLIRCTKFTKKELKIMYRGFKQVIHTGVYTICISDHFCICVEYGVHAKADHPRSTKASPHESLNKRFFKDKHTLLHTNHGRDWWANEKTIYTREWTNKILKKAVYTAALPRIGQYWEWPTERPTDRRIEQSRMQKLSVLWLISTRQICQAHSHEGVSAQLPFMSIRYLSYFQYSYRPMTRWHV